MYNPGVCLHNTTVMTLYPLKISEAEFCYCACYPLLELLLNHCYQLPKHSEDRNDILYLSTLASGHDHFYGEAERIR